MKKHNKKDDEFLQKQSSEVVTLNKVLNSIEPEKRQIILNAICEIEEHKSFSGSYLRPKILMLIKPCYLMCLNVY